MKKLIMIMAMMMTIATSATAMTYTQARQEALFLTDKMAYELGLNMEQYEAVYEINLDYMLSLTSQATIYGNPWARRNADLRYVLTAYQYDMYEAANYFYRPVYISNNLFAFRIYSAYADRSRFYMARPQAYTTYRGGHNTGTRSYYSTWRQGVQPTPSPDRSTWRNTQGKPQRGTTTAPANTARPATSGNSSTWRNSGTQQPQSRPATTQQPQSRSAAAPQQSVAPGNNAQQQSSPNVRLGGRR